jgi:hypothetical protein
VFGSFGDFNTNALLLRWKQEQCMHETFVPAAHPSPSPKQVKCRKSKLAFMVMRETMDSVLKYWRLW